MRIGPAHQREPRHGIAADQPLSTTERLRELQGMLDEELISQEQFYEKRQEMLNDL